MEKIYKILIVFGLLMLAITYSISARERKFREYFFSKRVPLLPSGDPGTGILLVMIGGEEDIVEAEDREDQLYFSPAPGGERELLVSDRQNGDFIAAIPLEERPDALIFDPATKMIYSYSSEGALTLIQQSGRGSYKVVQRMLVPKTGQVLGADPQQGRIWLSAGGSVYLYVNA
jgi:hypothetical protein